MIDVIARTTIVPKYKGRYAAFPTLSRKGDCVWLACRKGNTSPNTPHGDKGRVYLYFANVSDLTKWEGMPVIFHQTHDRGNELDAIINPSSSGGLTLVSRHYRSAGENVSYFSHLSFDSLQAGRNGVRPLIVDRFRLDERIENNGPGITIAAVFGHTITGQDQEKYMSCYAVHAQGRWPSPTILHSRDDGMSWRVRSVIEHSDTFGAYLNETSLLQTDCGQTLAVIRTDNEPWPLYFSVSDSALSEWTDLAETGLYGHAPMLVKGEDGKVFLFYRDLSADQPRVSCAIYVDGAWTFAGSIVSYTNIYNGGYCDALHLGKNRFFVTTYLDDADASPWIDGFVVEVNG